MKLDRKEALKHVAGKRAVIGHVKTVSGGKETRVPKEMREAKDFPPEEEGQEFTAMRDDSGNLTRAGMEHVIRSGGAVSYGGTVLERIADLPDEATLAAGNVERLKALADHDEQELAKILERKSQTQRAIKAAQDKAEAAEREAAEAEERRLAGEETDEDGKPRRRRHKKADDETKE